MLGSDKIQAMNEAAPLPSLIGSTYGRPSRVNVIGQAKCFYCSAVLAAGTSCIAIPKVEAGCSTPKRFCDECFQGILHKSFDDLEAVDEGASAGTDESDGYVYRASDERTRSTTRQPASRPA